MGSGSARTMEMPARERPSGACGPRATSPPPSATGGVQPRPPGGPPSGGERPPRVVVGDWADSSASAIVRDVRIELVEGDITEQAVDAIVNAANSSLMGGGGVDGAIHRRGGPQILAECKRIRRERYPDGLPTGMAVATIAGRLPSRWIIHTVGPVFSRSEDRSGLLASCHVES